MQLQSIMIIMKNLDQEQCTTGTELSAQQARKQNGEESLTRLINHNRSLVMMIIVIISMIVMIEISKEGESWSSLYYWLTNDNVDVWMIIKEAEQILYDILHGDGSLLLAIVD